MTKVLTIGSATMDVFVECDDANIVSVCSKTKNSDFMSIHMVRRLILQPFLQMLEAAVLIQPVILLI